MERVRTYAPTGGELNRARTGFAPRRESAFAPPRAVSREEQKKKGNTAGSTDVAKSRSPREAESRKYDGRRTSSTMNKPTASAGRVFFGSLFFTINFMPDVGM